MKGELKKNCSCDSWEKLKKIMVGRVEGVGGPGRELLGKIKQVYELQAKKVRLGAPVVCRICERKILMRKFRAHSEDCYKVHNMKNEVLEMNLSLAMFKEDCEKVVKLVARVGGDVQVGRTIQEAKAKIAPLLFVGSDKLSLRDYINEEISSNDGTSSQDSDDSTSLAREGFGKSPSHRRSLPDSGTDHDSPLLNKRSPLRSPMSPKSLALSGNSSGSPRKSIASETNSLRKNQFRTNRPSHFSYMKISSESIDEPDPLDLLPKDPDPKNNLSHEECKSKSQELNDPQNCESEEINSNDNGGPRDFRPRGKSGFYTGTENDANRIQTNDSENNPMGDANSFGLIFSKRDRLNSTNQGLESNDQSPCSLKHLPALDDSIGDGRDLNQNIPKNKSKFYTLSRTWS
jgi:hypothetical protein